MSGTPLAIQISDLQYRYPDGTMALEGVNLEVQEGERVALLGPNGAGKSTLLLHLNGLLRGEGEVIVLGLAVRGRALRQLRRQVGLVFQSPDDQLFMPSVYDEVAYSAINAGFSREEVQQRVQQALATTGITHLAEKHPDHLSLGQKKRVAIASVLVTDNRLLVLDEPSAGLDPAGRAALLALLQSLHTTMVIATHDLEFAKALCTRAIAMRHGRVYRVGALADVGTDPALFAISDPTA